MSRSIFPSLQLQAYSVSIALHKTPQRREEEVEHWRKIFIFSPLIVLMFLRRRPLIDRRKWKVIHIVCVCVCARVCVLAHRLVRGWRFVPHRLRLNVSPCCVSLCVCVCLYGCVLSLPTLIPFVMKHLPISPFIITQQEEEERGSVCLGVCVCVRPLQLLNGCCTKKAEVKETFYKMISVLALHCYTKTCLAS